jgi:hypothetical protein
LFLTKRYLRNCVSRGWSKPTRPTTMSSEFELINFRLGVDHLWCDMLCGYRNPAILGPNSFPAGAPRPSGYQQTCLENKLCHGSQRMCRVDGESTTREGMAWALRVPASMIAISAIGLLPRPTRWLFNILIDWATAYPILLRENPTIQVWRRESPGQHLELQAALVF